jgi:hypothetical protein
MRRRHAAALLAAVLACDGRGSTQPVVLPLPRVDRVVVDGPRSVWLLVPAALKLSARVEGVGDAVGAGVRWSGGAPPRITISADGTITTCAGGIAWAKATAVADTTKADSVQVTVAELLVGRVSWYGFVDPATGAPVPLTITGPTTAILGVDGEAFPCSGIETVEIFRVGADTVRALAFPLASPIRDGRQFRFPIDTIVDGQRAFPNGKYALLARIASLRFGEQKAMGPQVDVQLP